MSRITEEMIRKRAEHNNLEIFTLEELTLHQQDITRIELLDKMCRELKILYLQSNLIGAIENVQRLKKLEYLNLALNNIKRIQNLSGCESLNKLDLTVNFVSELTSVENLADNYNLRELFLTGNPCARFDGYRQFVVAAVPQLKTLDGTDIERSERIEAQQEMSMGLRDRIIQQQVECAEQERKQEEEDGSEDEDELLPGETEEEREKRYWEKESSYTPKSRIATQAHLRKVRSDNDKDDGAKKEKPARCFERDGRMLNMNDGKYDFSVDDSTQPDRVVLDLGLPRFMDMSLIDCDIQPTYVRVTAKEKVFQLVLPEEIQPDRSTAKRSKVTGHLVLTMPKVRQVLMKTMAASPPAAHSLHTAEQKSTSTAQVKAEATTTSTRTERLEVDSSGRVDIANIVSGARDTKPVAPSGTTRGQRSSLVQEVSASGIEDAKHASTSSHLKQEDSSDFEDDPDVPPLM